MPSPVWKMHFARQRTLVPSSSSPSAFFFLNFSETVSTVCDFQKLLAGKSSYGEIWELAHRDEVAFWKKLFDSIRFSLNLFVDTVCISSWKPWGVTIYDKMWPHKNFSRKAHQRWTFPENHDELFFFSSDHSIYFSQTVRKKFIVLKMQKNESSKKFFFKRLAFKYTCDIRV